MLMAAPYLGILRPVSVEFSFYRAMSNAEYSALQSNGGLNYFSPLVFQFSFSFSNKPLINNSAVNKNSVWYADKAIAHIVGRIHF